MFKALLEYLVENFYPQILLHLKLSGHQYYLVIRIARLATSAIWEWAVK